jgi:hypothetical protein
VSRSECCYLTMSWLRKARTGELVSATGTVVTHAYRVGIWSVNSLHVRSLADVHSPVPAALVLRRHAPTHVRHLLLPLGLRLQLRSPKT